jgi:hypothetical protein
MTSSTLLIAAAVALLLTGAANAEDACNKEPTCTMCLASTACGWCSTPVDYKNGGTGYRCATIAGADKFVCNGIFSTDQCQAGWECNTADGKCQTSPAGAGVPLATCKAQCTAQPTSSPAPVAAVFRCDNATHQCVKAKPYSAGSSSLPVCQAACAKHHSGTGAPVPPPTAVYKCNESTITCGEVPAGTSGSSSLQVCNMTCGKATAAPAAPTSSPGSPSTASPAAPTVAPAPSGYRCNPATLKCVPAESGTTMAACVAGCYHRKHHTPADLAGMWRSFSIANKRDGHQHVEADLWFTSKGHVKRYDAVWGHTQCTVDSVGPAAAIYHCPVHTWYCVSEPSNGMPETYQRVMGCSPHKMPASVAALIESETFLADVRMLQKCVVGGSCKFEFAKPPLPPHAHKWAVPPPMTIGDGADREPLRDAATDACNAFAANCSYCIASTGCGWCSTPVTYRNGHPGSRCAGGAGFKCSGTYRTESCPVGYTCDAVAAQCKMGKPGLGFPTKQACEAGCKVAPGPPPGMAGHWRGLTTSNDYLFGEYSLTFLDGGRFKFNKTLGEALPMPKRSGTVTHRAGVITFNFTAPLRAGAPTVFDAIYTETRNTWIKYMTLAWNRGSGAAPVPTPDGYQTPMLSGTEMILAHCAIADCKW